MSSTVMQTKEFLDNRYFISEFVFQSKQTFNLIYYIEKNLAPLYKKKMMKYSNLKKKNLKFRNNEVNYLTILHNLDYYVNLLEELSFKFDGLIWVQCTQYNFIKFFPNITNLFYERYFLRELIPGIEEGEIEDDDAISDKDYFLYGIAKNLSDLGLKCVDNCLAFILYDDKDDDYDDYEVIPFLNSLDLLDFLR